MNPDQIDKLLGLLSKISESLPVSNYTITGAADWPLLLSLGAVCLSLIGWMWRDLKADIKGNKGEWKESLQAHKSENEKAHDLLWQAHNECQAECCPRRKD